MFHAISIVHVFNFKMPFKFWESVNYILSTYRRWGGGTFVPTPFCGQSQGIHLSGNGITLNFMFGSMRHILKFEEIGSMVQNLLTCPPRCKMGTQSAGWKG